MEDNDDNERLAQKVYEIAGLIEGHRERLDVHAEQIRSIMMMPWQIFGVACVLFTFLGGLAVYFILPALNEKISYIQSEITELKNR